MKPNNIEKPTNEAAMESFAEILDMARRLLDVVAADTGSDAAKRAFSALMAARAELKKEIA